MLFWIVAHRGRAESRRILAALGAAMSVGLCAIVLWSTFSATDAETLASARVYVCAETGRSFQHTLERGETLPVYSPHSGRNTGYPAELCSWTREGSPAAMPTAVLLNEMIGKPGRTFCPDCGRLVTRYNPPAVAGATPPPTAADASHGSMASQTGGGGDDVVGNDMAAH